MMWRYWHDGAYVTNDTEGMVFDLYGDEHLDKEFGDMVDGRFECAHDLLGYLEEESVESLKVRALLDLVDYIEDTFKDRFETEDGIVAEEVEE